MARCADALKAGFIPTLVDGSALGDGALETGRVGAEEYFRSPIDMAVCKEATWAELSIGAHVGIRNDDSRMLYPLWVGLGGFFNGWKGREHSDEFGGGRGRCGSHQ